MENPRIAVMQSCEVAGHVNYETLHDSTIPRLHECLRQLPRLPVVVGQQPVGFFVVDDSLGGAVPLQVTAPREGDFA